MRTLLLIFLCSVAALQAQELELVPDPTQRVPKLVGKSLTDKSSATLKPFTIKLTHVSSQKPEGTILKTFPAGGQRIESGAVIRLFVSSGSPARETTIKSSPKIKTGGETPWLLFLFCQLGIGASALGFWRWYKITPKRKKNP